MSQAPPSNFTIPPTLSLFAVPMSSYLASHPAHVEILSGVLVFSKSKHGSAHASGHDRGPDKILLLQRASHDFMPNLWETPGGCVDAEDATILHGAARELWEEAGLRVTAFRTMVGDAVVFGTSRTSRGVEFVKLSFLVDVEAEADELLEVKIDPDEHQRFVWASEDECRPNRVGSLEIEFTSQAQQQTILEGLGCGRRRGLIVYDARRACGV
jgi:8-oxo-dGTP pyrophosphatase MutT (NUDIX family)